MPRKRGPPGVNQDGVPQDPRGRVKAGLLCVVLSNLAFP
jgi:hypothetical protein